MEFVVCVCEEDSWVSMLIEVKAHKPYYDITKQRSDTGAYNVNLKCLRMYRFLCVNTSKIQENLKEILKGATWSRRKKRMDESGEGEKGKAAGRVKLNENTKENKGKDELMKDGRK